MTNDDDEQGFYCAAHSRSARDRLAGKFKSPKLDIINVQNVSRQNLWVVIEMGGGGGIHI
jgi:hypothetical protein